MVKCPRCGKENTFIGKKGRTYCSSCKKWIKPKNESLVDNICNPIYEHLNEMYNWRKQKEGLISKHNILIDRLRGVIKEFQNKENNDEDYISSICNGKKPVKIVEVEWLDAQSSNQRFDLEELEDLKPLLTHSVGYLLINKKEHIILGFTDFGNGVIKHLQLIPREMIKEIRVYRG